MKSIRPIALKETKLLSNEEMKHLFGGSAATLTCTFSCEGGESVTATDCASCKVQSAKQNVKEEKTKCEDLHFFTQNKM